MKKKFLVAAGLGAAMLIGAGTAFADSDNNWGRGHDDDNDRGLRLGAFIGLGNNAELKARWDDDKDAAKEFRNELKADIKSRWHDERKDDHDDDDGDDDKRHALRGTVSAISGTTLTLLVSDGTTYTVNAANASVKGGTVADIDVGDSVVISGSVDGTAVVAGSILDLTLLKELAAERMSHFTAGVVTNVSGSVFTIDPRGDKDVTTVTTDGSTIFKVNGQTATSGALAVGSKVFLVGTTTATSTSADAFSASIVHIFTEGFKHLKRWLNLR